MNHRSQGYEPCEIPLLYPARTRIPGLARCLTCHACHELFRIFISFLKEKNMNNKNLNQGGVPSCVPDGKYTRQDSNLLEFPLKRVYQLHFKERRIRKKMSKTTVVLCFPLHNYIITDFSELPLYHFCVFRAYHEVFLRIF